MAVQQFCLRWNNHQPNFISVFSNLLNSESLVDVTLAAEGRHLQAHKVVLSACSSYFQSLFMVNPCQHPIVILKDVKFIDLKVMVDFMYYGEVNVSQEQLPNILKTAEMLKIKGLAEMPDSTSLTKRDISKTQAEEWDDEKRKKLRKSENICVEERETTTESVQMEQGQHNMQMPPEIQQQVVQQQPPPPPMETPMMEMGGGDPSTSQQGLPPTTPTVHHPGVQWTLVEQPYPLQTPTIPPPPIHYIHQYQPPPPATPETPNAAPASPCPSICPSTSPAPPSTPPKRKRSINPQADENFVRALEAVRFGGIGFCKAARMFGVNNRTLWLEYKKRGYVVTRPSIKNRVKVEKEDDGDQDGVPPPTPPPPQQQQHQQVEFAPQQGFLGGAVEFRGQPPPLGGQHINLGGGMHFN